MIDKNKVRAIVAPTSEGPAVALFGANKATREGLAQQFGKPTPGGYWIVTTAQAEQLSKSK